MTKALQAPTGLEHDIDPLDTRGTDVVIGITYYLQKK
jgi:hypothetical protein